MKEYEVECGLNFFQMKEMLKKLRKDREILRKYGVKEEGYRLRGPYEKLSKKELECLKSS